MRLLGSIRDAVLGLQVQQRQAVDAVEPTHLQGVALIPMRSTIDKQIRFGRFWERSAEGAHRWSLKRRLQHEVAPHLPHALVIRDPGEVFLPIVDGEPAGPGRRVSGTRGGFSTECGSSR